MEETEAGVANGPISLVAMIGFHHTKGHITEWVYPAPVSGEGDFRHLAMLCLPEGAHTVEGLGHVFFTIELALAPVGPKQMYYGVSIFGQVKTAEVLGMVRGAGDKSENKRAVVQKAVAALGREPSFWWLHSRLRPAAQDLFTRKDFSRVAVLQDVVRTAGPESMEECVASIERHPDLSEAQLLLVQRFGRNTLLLFKLLLLEPRLVLFAAGCAEASSLVLALVSLVSRLLHSFSPALQLSMSLPAPGGHDGAAGRAACRSAGGPRLTPTTPVSIRQRLQEHASACSPERKLSPPSASPSVEDDSAPFSAASPMGEDNGGGVWGVAATSVQNHSSTSVGVNGGTSGGPRERAASINAPLPAALQEGIHSGSAPSGLQQAEKKEKRDRKPRLQILPPEVVGGGSESCEGGVNEDMRMHGLPLRIFHSRNHMEPYLPMELLAQSRPCGPAPGSAQQGSVQTGSGQGTGGRGGQGERIAGGQSDELPSAPARLGGSFLVGSSNRMFLLPANPSQLDVVADAETGQVHVLSERLGRAANLSVHERQVADALVHLVAQHTHTVRRAREAREEAAVSSHMAAAAAAAEVVAGGGCVQHSFGAAAAGFAAEDAAVMADSVKSMAETVREELARYLLRLLQAAARHAATAIWSPDSLSRDLAVRRLSPCALALALSCAGECVCMAGRRLPASLPIRIGSSHSCVPAGAMWAQRACCRRTLIRIASEPMGRIEPLRACCR